MRLLNQDSSQERTRLDLLRQILRFANGNLEEANCKHLTDPGGHKAWVKWAVSSKSTNHNCKILPLLYHLQTVPARVLFQSTWSPTLMSRTWYLVDRRSFLSNARVQTTSCRSPPANWNLGRGRKRIRVTKLKLSAANQINKDSKGKTPRD